ncbi:MAG TPA: hypothetical protein PKC49_03475 [Phycisphaerae bacterium]|nr:hypothetical protein [Phycisphaerae bacterium]
MTRNEAIVANREQLAAAVRRYRDAQTRLFVATSAPTGDAEARRWLCALEFDGLRQSLREMEAAVSEVFELEQERKRLTR